MSAIILEVNPCFMCVATVEMHHILGSKLERKGPLGSFRRRRVYGSKLELKELNRTGGCGLKSWRNGGLS